MKKLLYLLAIVGISISAMAQNSYSTGWGVHGQNDPEYGPEITGTPQYPLTIEQFKAVTSAGTSIPNTYLQGFIVGYVPGAVLDEAVINDVTGDNVSATNILLAASLNPTSIDDCVPVQLPAGTMRNALNLKEKPLNLGKAVTLLGTHTNYLGVTGLKWISAYAFGDEEIVPPSPQPDAIYVGLADNCADWQFVTTEMPVGLTYIWRWNDGSYGKYLVGTAYHSKDLTAESYAISPVIDLTGQREVRCSFEHAAKYQTTIRELCGIVVREEGALEWTPLVIPTWPEAGSWEFVNSGYIDLSAYDGKKIQVAFKYKSSAEYGADTWQIRNFVVDAKPVGSLSVGVKDGLTIKQKIIEGEEVSVNFNLDKYWRLSSLSLNGMDVLDSVTTDGDYTTPALAAIENVLEGNGVFDGEVYFTDASTGVAILGDTGVSIAVEKGKIVIRGTEVGDEIRLYTMSGQLIRADRATGDCCDYDLEQYLHGRIYLVCVKGKAAQVMLP